MQQVQNELNEKLRTFEDRSRRDKLYVVGIPKYEKESWDEAGVLHNIMVTTCVCMIM